MAKKKEELSPRERALLKPPCPLCAVAIGGDLISECNRCGALMHMECYWGRIASLDEWKAYIRKVVETDDEDGFAPVLCAACRQIEGRGK